MISVIIPTLNEESTIGGLLEALQADGFTEILVADGGSTDRTRQIASQSATVIECPRGRAAQMNHAAQAATFDILLFLHADTRLEAGAYQAIAAAFADRQMIGGNFDIHFEGGDRTARIFSAINRFRYRFGIIYGDSGIFCRRAGFVQLNGYRNWPILEDYDFGRRLARLGTIVNLPHPIHVSDRRWRNAGIFPTLWCWFWIQALYLAGVSPFRLARFYRHVR